MKTSFPVALHQLMLAACVLLGNFYQSEARSCSGAYRYQMKFTGMWTAARHPVAYPSNAIFSPLVLASHDNSYTMWEQGEMASLGVQEVAETGNPAVLRAELQMAQRAGTVTDFVHLGGPSNSNEPQYLNITVDEKHALVSMVTMLFPSPDWFTGFRDIDMCNRKTGRWKTVEELYLAGYDGGSDSGMSFNSMDEETDPQEDISQLVCGEGVFCDAGEDFEPLALVEFTYVPIRCEGARRYKLKVGGKWTSKRHPVAYPDEAGFSPLVAAAHSSDISFFEMGEPVSAGLQMVAETGNPSVLAGELFEQRMAGPVFDIAVGEGPFPGNKWSGVIEITADTNHPYISVVTMIFPSPDWFTGARNLNMCDTTTGRWRKGYTTFMTAYDAGTDMGSTFLSDDEPNDTPGVVTMIPCGQGVFCEEGEDLEELAVIAIY